MGGLTLYLLVVLAVNVGIAVWVRKRLIRAAAVSAVAAEAR